MDAIGGGADGVGLLSFIYDGPTSAESIVFSVCV